MRREFVMLSFLGLLGLAAGPYDSAWASGGSPSPPGATETEPFEIHLRAVSFDPLVSVPEPRPGLGLKKSNGYAIVQFRGAASDEWKAALASMGVELLGYLPNHAFLVRHPPGTEKAIARLAFVRWIGFYHPEYKLEPGLLEATGELDVVVSVFAGADPGEARRVILASGGRIVEELSSPLALRATLPEAAVIPLAHVPGVESIDRSGPPEADMNHVRGFVGGSAVFAGGFAGAGLRPNGDRRPLVGEVMDLGIDETHPDFVGQLTIDGGFNRHEHGTSCYGIVFGTGGGDATATGFLPEGDGIFANAGMMTRRQAADNLVTNFRGHFQSHSWGAGGAGVRRDNTYTVLSRENDLIVFDLGITMTQSMSNFGHQPWPNARREAMAKNIISVGGLWHLDDGDRANDTWAMPGQSSGSVGPAADGRQKPDLAGPYDRVRTTDCDIPGVCDGYEVGPYTDLFNGTSAATPITAGAAGLVYEMYHANVFGRNATGSTPRPSTVKAILINNAYPYDLATQATRDQQGWGLPDAGAAHDVGTDHFIIDETVPLRPGTLWTFNAESDGRPLKVTLVWTDPAAAAGAGIALVNNLDLVLTDPNGNVFAGNNGMRTSWVTAPGFGTNPWYRPVLPGARFNDNLNNVENVFVNATTPGVWTIAVRATNVPVDGDPFRTPGAIDQPFALVVQGLCFDCENCGNGTIDPGEECDGLNLNGATCVSLGFDGGTLRCGGTRPGCAGRACNVINNPCTGYGDCTCLRFGPDVYDGACISLEPTCGFDLSGCFRCGNGIVEDGETCDDGNRNSGDGCSNTCQCEGCGTYTSDVTLHCDIVAPASACGGCIRLAADNIRLDGNNHTVTGPASPSCVGVRIAGNDGVEVTGLRLEGWWTGIQASGGTDGLNVHHNSISDVDWGITVAGTPGSSFSDVVVDENFVRLRETVPANRDVGVSLQWNDAGTGNRVSGNWVDINRSNVGVRLYQANGVLVRDNLLFDSAASFGTTGVELLSTMNAVVTENLAGGLYAGVTVDDSFENWIVANELVYNRSGVSIEHSLRPSRDNHFAGNVIEKDPWAFGFDFNYCGAVCASNDIAASNTINAAPVHHFDGTYRACPATFGGTALDPLEVGRVDLVGCEASSVEHVTMTNGDLIQVWNASCPGGAPCVTSVGVRDSSVRDSVGGIWVQGGKNVAATGNTLESSARDMMVVEYVTGMLATNNTIRNSGNAGISLIAAHDGFYLQNTVTASQGIGAVTLYADNQRNLFLQNTVNDNPYYGFYLLGASLAGSPSFNEFRLNTIAGNNPITSVDFKFCGGAGIGDLRGNRLLENTFTAGRLEPMELCLPGDGCAGLDVCPPVDPALNAACDNVANGVAVVPCN